MCMSTSQTLVCMCVPKVVSFEYRSASQYILFAHRASAVFRCIYQVCTFSLPLGNWKRWHSPGASTSSIGFEQWQTIITCFSYNHARMKRNILNVEMVCHISLEAVSIGLFCLIPGTDSELIPKDHGHILILKVEKLVNCSVRLQELDVISVPKVSSRLHRRLSR